MGINIEKLVNELKDKGIRLSVDDHNDLNIKAPKEIMTRELLMTIKDNKANLVSYFKNFHVEKEEIQPTKIKNDGYHISDAQRRLWVLSQLKERSLAYNIQSGMELNGVIEIDTLKKAFDYVIERHDSLRTVFRENHNGEVKQWILTKEETNFSIKYFDFRNKEDKDVRIKMDIKEDSSLPFDLAQGPLIRASLLHRSENEYLFYFNMHHIISDGVSMDVLQRDVLAAYHAFQKGEIPNLPNLRIQYKDYVAWQMDQLNKEGYKKHKEYWLRKLSGEIPLLDLPNQKLRPKVKTYNGCTLKTYISASVTNKLKSFCLEHGGTTFMGVLAIWNILFYRYTGNRDHIIGTPVAGRNHADLEDQIGIYLNTLILRNQINPKDNFIDTFLKIKEATLESSKHQEYPFDRLIDELSLTIDISRNPLYDVMLSYHNTGENNDKITLENEEIDRIIVQENKTSKLDMLINFMEKGEYFYFDINYNTDIYDVSSMKILMSDFKQLLSKIMDNPIEEIETIDYQKSKRQSLRKKNLKKFEIIRK
jgi:hypothetical protein